MKQSDMHVATQITVGSKAFRHEIRKEIIELILAFVPIRWSVVASRRNPVTAWTGFLGSDRLQSQSVAELRTCMRLENVIDTPSTTVGSSVVFFAVRQREANEDVAVSSSNCENAYQINCRFKFAERDEIYVFEPKIPRGCWNTRLLGTFCFAHFVSKYCQ